VVPFAREIGIDLISPNRLRYEKYSGLARLVDESDDYYVGEGNRVFSTWYGPDDINRIVKRISSGFFDRRQMWAVARKGLRIGFPGWIFYLHLIFGLPRIISRAKRRRKRLRAEARASSARG
ncbi:MAG TPA: hypothetical protein VMX79_07745, partial [bacterium]|nr:hypothetical protein [bacterium]